MTFYRSGTKGDLERRRRKQPANFLHNVIKESVPSTHILKAERTNIVDSFKDLYQAYWANSQGELTIVTAMDAAELTLRIFNYTQHLADIAASAQKTSDENAWAVLQAQAKLKARTKEIAILKAVIAKKSPVSEETLSPLLERAQQEAEAACNQLVHVETEVQDLRSAWKELQSALRRLGDSEAEITRLKELLPKEKPVKHLVSYNELSNSPRVRPTTAKPTTAANVATERRSAPPHPRLNS